MKEDNCFICNNEVDNPYFYLGMVVHNDCFKNEFGNNKKKCFNKEFDKNHRRTIW